MSVQFAGPSASSLRPRTVHLWTASLSIADRHLVGLWPLLSADERERALRFVFERDRHWFVAARGFLRDLLSAYTGVTPASLRFTYGERGKPALDPDHGSRVEFNVSHSGGLAVFAITSDSAVGVDVEEVRALDDADCLARQCFAPGEQQELARLMPASRLQAFFNCWTRKEAYIKALGEGLSCPLESFEVTLAPGDRAGLRSIDGAEIQAARWWMHAFVPAPGFVGAVVVRGFGHTVESGWIYADAVQSPGAESAFA